MRQTICPTNRAGTFADSLDAKVTVNKGLTSQRLHPWCPGVRSEESEVSSENFSRETCVFSKNAGMLYLKANRRQMKADG